MRSLKNPTGECLPPENIAKLRELLAERARIKAGTERGLISSRVAEIETQLLDNFPALLDEIEAGRSTIAAEQLANRAFCKWNQELKQQLSEAQASVKRLERKVHDQRTDLKNRMMEIIQRRSYLSSCGYALKEATGREKTYGFQVILGIDDLKKQRDDLRRQLSEKDAVIRALRQAFREDGCFVSAGPDPFSQMTNEDLLQRMDPALNEYSDA